MSRRRSLAAPASLLGLLLPLSLGACGSGTVEITSPSPPPVERTSCQALLDALPTSLDDQAPRETEPADALGAAYGDPAIVLTCGGSMPADFDEFSPCLESDGVGWYIPEDQLGSDPKDVVMTTVGYRPVVQVTVPDDYWPQGAAAVQADLATAIKQHLTRESRCV